MQLPLCTPECRYYDAVQRLEAQSVIMASLIKERDGLLLLQEALIARVDS